MTFLRPGLVDITPVPNTGPARPRGLRDDLTWWSGAGDPPEEYRLATQADFPPQYSRWPSSPEELLAEARAAPGECWVRDAS